MKYFLHDTNAFHDEKVSELYIRFGYEGVGLFFTTLERIAAQEKPVKTEVLKLQLHIGKKLEKAWQFMEEIGLLSSKNGETFNENLLKFSEKYAIKKEKTRERVARFREQSPDKELDVENVTRYTDVTKRSGNADKVKGSKVKEIESIGAAPKTRTLSERDLTDKQPPEEMEPDHPLLTWCKKEAPTVMKMQKPLTNTECTKLLTEYDRQEVAAVLRAMENKPNLTDKKTGYKSAYLTILNWLEARRKSAPPAEVAAPSIPLAQKLKLQNERSYD